MNIEPIDVDDVGAALREGRALVPARAYSYRLAGPDLDFQVARVADPVPLGRQILEGAGLHASPDYSLVAILSTGEFENVGLNEPFDLRGRGVERFVAFRTDRLFKLEFVDLQLLWGESTISGATLRTLGGVGPEFELFLDVPGGQDRLIEPGTEVDLTAPGVERFVVVKRPAQSWEITVNSRLDPVPIDLVTYEQVVRLAYPNASVEANVIYTVTFRHVASTPHSGDLAVGGSVHVKHEGSVFNVARTIQS